MACGTHATLSLACSLALCARLLAASRGQGDWQQRLQARKDRRCAQGHCSRLDCLQPAAEERCKSSTSFVEQKWHALACLLYSLAVCHPPGPPSLSPFLGQLREAYGTKKYVPTDLRPKRTRAIRRRLSKREVRESTLVPAACSGTRISLHSSHLTSVLLLCVRAFRPLPRP